MKIIASECWVEHFKLKADLDRRMEIEDDLFAGLVILEDKYVKPTRTPGLGISRKRLLAGSVRFYGHICA